MDTSEIMKIACDMAGFNTIPLDSAIYVSGDNIKKVLFGIDITSAEIKIAKDLNYDLVISHHPHAIGNKYELFRDHIKQMTKAGVPQDVAEDVVNTKLESFELADHITNYDHVVSVAELLNMPFMNIHQPCDEMGRRILQSKIDEQLARDVESSLQDIVDALYEIPEFDTAYTDIKIRMGNPNGKAGKVLVSHGAYSYGGYEIASTYFDYGIDTIVYLHVKEGDLKKLREESKGNLIATGHLVGDEIGINPLVDTLRDKGLEIDLISGIIHRKL